MKPALAEGGCELREIAAGMAPRQGQPARFVNLLEPRKPVQADDDAPMDLRATRQPDAGQPRHAAHAPHSGRAWR
ncbi:hypothetical protein ACTMU2_09660 [Cupriavidus basilensis]